MTDDAQAISQMMTYKLDKNMLPLKCVFYKLSFKENTHSFMKTKSQDEFHFP